MPKARTAVLRAVEIDDTLGEAHGVLARLKFFYDWDWVAAETEFKRALELNPNDTMARVFYSSDLAVLGRLDEGMAEIRRAWELDPLSLIVNAAVGLYFYAGRQYEQAIEQSQKTLEMESNFMLAHWALWRAFRLRGRYEEALDEWRKIYSLMGNREVVEAIEQGYAESGYKGAMRGAAEKLVAQSKKRYLPATDTALLYAHVEEKDQAIEWLEKAYEERDPRLHTVGVDPDWESLRPNPRFRDLLRRLGLSEIEPRQEG